MSNIALYPKNDLAFTLTLYDVDTATGLKTPLISGSLNVFLATTGLADAVIADATLTGTGVNLSAQTPGKWLIYVDAAKLQDVTLLDSLFGGTGVAYCIVEQTNNIRVAVPLAYFSERDATES